MSYVVPQVKVFQEFTAVPTAITEPLRAFIAGPHYQLIRYTDSDEKANGNLGDYAPDVSATLYSFPNLTAGAVVDSSFVRVFIDDAYLRYFQESTGSGDTVKNVLNAKNKIRLAATNLVAFTHPDTGVVYARAAALLRDVKVGDVAKVTLGSDEVEAVITALENDQTASAIAAATADANNGETQVESATWAKTAGFANRVRLEFIDPSAYDGLADGDNDETYTIEVIQGSSGGDATTAKFNVSSASGRDDVLNVSPDAAFDQLISIGTRGAKALFTNGVDPGAAYGYGSGGDDFVVGQKWQVDVTQDYTKVNPTSGGNYTGAEDTTYIAEVTTGGKAGAAKISISTTKGNDSSGPHAVADANPITIGQFGVTIALDQTTLRKGDKFYVAATAADDAAIRTLVLSKNLASSMLDAGAGGPDLALELYIKKDMEVSDCVAGVTQWEVTSAVKLSLNGSVVGFDSTWVDGDGVMQSLPVRQGTVFVHYRALLKTFSIGVQTISTASSVEATLGPAEPDNPLALGVLKALQNANGTAVKYMAVESDDVAGYSTVLETIIGRIDVYSLVPMTFTTAILDLFQSHVNAMSTPTQGRWRIAWFGVQAITTQQVGSEESGTIDEQPGQSGSGDYVYIEAAGATFADDGARAGDMLRTNFSTDACGVASYDEYQISSVENNETLILVAGPSNPVTVAQKMEVWRTLTKNEQATAIGQIAGRYADRRIRVVWPDPISSGGTSMAGYYGAAALAGLRSGVVPQQGLTNVEVAGFDEVRGDYFNATQLNTMAESGVWIITEDPQSGKIFNRHQVTTGDTGDLKKREDNVTTNVDSISMFFLNQLKPFIGQANLTEQTLALIQTQLESLIGRLKSNGTSEIVGGQLIDGNITKIERDAVLLDKVNIEVALTVPFAINNIDVSLRI